MNYRQIKFRAWDVKNNKWYEPTYMAHEGKLHELNIMLNGSWVIRTKEGTCHQSASDEEFVIMQYTGLKDKNGKEIYEGDVVRTFSRTEVVEFGEYKDCEDDYGFYTVCGCVMRQYDSGVTEVIGNVFENPELK